jgi:hypothetical protein
MGTMRRSESPGRCRALITGSREKTADNAVSSARTPKRKTNGARRLSGKRLSRRSARIQATSRSPATAYAGEIAEGMNESRRRRAQAAGARGARASACAGSA